MDKLEIRNAVNTIIQFTSELNKYKSEGVKKEIFEECREKIVKLLHPIAPHVTEEIWEIIGKKGYISLTSWPTYDNKLLTEESEYKWKLLNNIVEDIGNIKLAMKKKSIENISIIIADDWKLKFYNQLMKLLDKTKNQGEIMKNLTQYNDFKRQRLPMSIKFRAILNLCRPSTFGCFHRRRRRPGRPRWRR